MIANRWLQINSPILKKKAPIEFAFESDCIDEMERNASQKSEVQLEQRNVEIAKIEKIFKDLLRDSKATKENHLQLEKKKIHCMDNHKRQIRCQRYRFWRNWI